MTPATPPTAAPVAWAGDEGQQAEADIGERPQELRGLLVVEPKAIVYVHWPPLSIAGGPEV